MEECNDKSKIISNQSQRQSNLKYQPIKNSFDSRDEIKLMENYFGWILIKISETRIVYESQIKFLLWYSSHCCLFTASIS